MDKKKFEELLKPLIEIYDQIELDLINNILEKLKYYNNPGGSINWYLEKLVDLKVLKKSNYNLIKKNNHKVQLELERILKESANNNNSLDRLNQLYQTGKINIDPIKVFNSSSSNNLINNALKDSTNIIELINTSAVEGANETYKNIINQAYIETDSGIYTYEESIRRALKKMAKEGISLVHYESGRKISIESALRRDIITRTNKLVGDVELQHAKELNTNLVYVDQHLGARTRTKYTKNDYEAHDEWQGKKYMIEGSSDKYDNLYEKTGYGEMLGLKGINCYHNIMVTFEWEDIPKRISEEESKKVYKQLEKQREYERKIRELKRERLIAKEIGDKEEYDKSNKKYNKINEEYNQFLSTNNLSRNYNREYINNQYKDIQEKYKVGNFDIKKFTNDFKTTTNDVILNPNRLQHLNKHPEVLKYVDELPKILNDPDEVYQQLDKTDTIWIIKKMDNNLKITIKLNTETASKKEKGYKNSIIQMQFLNEMRIKKYIKNKKIKLLFDKKLKK